jgi:predicted Fe-Mo cluster-binding NifX family protein
VIKLLLKQRGADIVITREVVKIIARQFRQGVIMALLKEKGADVVITEEVVKVAVRNS